LACPKHSARPSSQQLHTIRRLSLGVSSSKVCTATGIYSRIFIGIRKSAAAVPSTDSKNPARPRTCSSLDSIQTNTFHQQSAGWRGQLARWAENKRVTDKWDAYAAVIATTQTTTLQQPFLLPL